MKNIHLIPTSKPSRLHLAYNKNYYLSIEPFVQLDTKNYKSFNIYVTSDSEIKEEDWIGYSNLKKWVPVKYLGGDLISVEKKIILTTDQSLDGIQPIDDTFLEWFVKNPSCKKIEVCKNPFYEESNYEHYKIIIPQQEDEQEEEEVECNMCDSLMSYDEENGIYICTNSECTRCYEEYEEEPKQETIEEAANKIYPNDEYDNETYCDLGELYREKWLEGAKWQAERMYSEEEVYDIINSFEKLCYTYQSNKDWFPAKKSEWFEQFKKK